ncbi:teichoic acid transporter [Kocuria tytonicola]|uniref:Lipopolysaccharide biosynthesis protein n=1 Tax=Kocuria tytonicola TaxID=2055946 RepID=A0A3L9L2T7_9MICC|nr:lipopolysaccharide biosynthesis protein [Kocuria tytonicola]RLY92279.1 lipopolysaccharide biosynthesis protein [Kocuria tytonicola]RLZ03815.1 teichoic acid transporter [Kocuria tytonicola]
MTDTPAVRTPPPETEASRVGTNILWNYVSGFTSVFGLLLLYPFAIAIVGAESYGLWVIAFSAIQLLTMSDFGLGTGIVRTLTDIPDDAAHARRRQSFVAVAIGVFLVLAVVLTGLYFVFFPLYLTTVDVPERDQHAVVPLLLAAGFTLFFSVLGRACNSVLWALNRPDVERKAAVVAILGRAAGYALLIPFQGGLIALVLVECVSLLLPPAVCLWAVHRRFGLARPLPGAWREQGRPLLRMSSVLSIGSLSLLGVYQLPLFIVGPTLGLHAATAFGALIRVFQSARLVISWIAMPFAYPIKKSQGGEAAEHIRVAMTVSLLVGLMISIPLLAIPTELLSVWLGPAMAFAAPALAMVVLGVLGESLGQVPNLVMTLRGSPLVASLISLGILVVTLPAVWFAAQTGNLEVVMAASTAPLLLAVPVQLVFSERAESSRAGAADLRTWVLMLLAAAAGAVVFVLAGRVLPDVLTIGVCGAALGAVFLAAFRRIRRRDRELNSARSADAQDAVVSSS